MRRGMLVALVVLATPLVASSAPSGLTFDALSYNVAGLPEGISSSEPATNSPLISPLLNAYDLVLLQEDWADPIEAAPLFFFHHQIVAEADHPYRSDPAPAPLGTDLRRFPSGPTLIADGLNRLSNFAFGELQRVMWETCHGEFHIAVAEAIAEALGIDEPIEDAGAGAIIDGGAADCGAQKGFSVARTDFGGAMVDVYNLHGEAGGGEPDLEARAAGFEQLATFISEFSAGRAIILGGDTNLHTDGDRPADGAVWSAFKAATGLIDVCDTLDCGADFGRIDKFAYRNDGGVIVHPLSHAFAVERFTREDGEPLSDHDPLHVRFEVTGDAVVLPQTGGPGIAVAVGLASGALALVLRRRAA